MRQRMGTPCTRPALMPSLTSRTTSRATTARPSRRRRARAPPSSSPRRFCSSRWCCPGSRSGASASAIRRARHAVHLDDVRRPQGRLGAAHRHADRRDAGGGDDGVRARAPLFHRLHGRGPVPAAVLRLSVVLHLRDAGAGDVRQPRAVVLRLGGRGARELSADRLLVSQARGQRRRDQGLHRQPRRRFRLRARHFRRVHDDGLDRARHRVRAGARRSPARPSTSSAGTPTR